MVIYAAVRSMMNILNSGRICAPSSLNQNLRSEGEDEYKARLWGHQAYTRRNPALHTLKTSSKLLTKFHRVSFHLLKEIVVRDVFSCMCDLHLTV
jgi:hypothetical protein